jgi:hypothetical protein
MVYIILNFVFGVLFVVGALLLITTHLFGFREPMVDCTALMVIAIGLKIFLIPAPKPRWGDYQEPRYK